MKRLNALAGSMIAVSLMVAPAAFAADPSMKQDMGAMNHDMGAVRQGQGMMNHDMGAVRQDQGMMKYDMHAFMKSCDMDHDGMLSRDEMTKHMEKMFDRMDTKKSGKLDSKQTESFLKELTRQSGA